MTVGQLLGPVRFGRDGAWTEPRPSKPLQLLCYLAYAGGWVTRERLAFLFWPDSPDSTAKVNLRQLLRRARAMPFAEELEVEGERVRWPIATDVAQLREAVAEGRWADACELYRGPLLDGISGDDNDALEAWLELEREGLARAWHKAAMAWATQLEREQSYGAAAELLGRLLAAEALAEDVLQRYLGAAYLDGRRDEALRSYEAFEQRLRDELELEPLEETQALAASIRAAAPLKLPETPQPERSKIPLMLLRPPQLIGRERDIESLRGADTVMVALRGEAGSGKSRLLAEIAPDALALRAQEGMQGVPYYPLTVAIRQRLEADLPAPDLGPYRPDLARLVPEVDPDSRPEPSDPDTAKVRLLEALARFIEAQSATVLFDDLQWCDEPTLTVLGHLIHRGRVRVFAAYRQHEAGPTLRSALDGLSRAGLLSEHTLAPLDGAGVERLMASLSGSERGPPLFSRWLWDRAGGNPMFTLETLKALFESGVLSADEAGWHSAIDDITRDYGELQVPAAVSQVIERRVARLSDGAVRVLKSASVAGPELDAELLASVSGLSQGAVLDALSEAEEGDLVQGDRFAHDLVRQSLYAALGQRQRLALHAQVAEHLPAASDASIRAEHWLAARQIGPAVTAWLEAVEDRRAKGLFDAAQLLLERGIEHCDDVALRQRLEARLVEVFQQAGRNAEALARSEALLADCDLPELRAAAYNARALVQLREGHIEDAAVSVEQGKREYGLLGIVALPSNFTMTRAILHHARGEYDAAIALLEPLASALRQAPASDDLGTVLTSLAAAYDVQGEPLRALPLHREALSFVKAQGYRYFQVDAALNLLYCLMDLGRADEGLTEGEAALELGEYENSATLRTNLATAYFELGRYDDARRHYEQVTEQSEHGFLLAITWARLADTYLRLGRTEEVPTALAQAIAQAEGTDFQLARARVLATTLRLGTTAQIDRVRPWFDGLDLEALPSYVQSELDEVR